MAARQPEPKISHFDITSFIFYFNLMSAAVFCESMNEARLFTSFKACWYKLNPIWFQRWPSHCKKICGFDTVGSDVETLVFRPPLSRLSFAGNY